jgi:hypothetical protein
MNANASASRTCCRYFGDRPCDPATAADGFLLSRTERAVTRQGSETTSGRISLLHEIVRAVDVAAE